MRSEGYGDPATILVNPRETQELMHTRVLSFHPQPLNEHRANAVAPLTHKQVAAIYKKSQQSGFSFDLLEQVFERGRHAWRNERGGTLLSEDEYAFNRVNSFVAGGRAAIEDVDLLEDTPSDREEGTTSLTRTYTRTTPGQCIKTIKRVLRSKRR